MGPHKLTQQSSLLECWVSKLQRFSNRSQQLIQQSSLLECWVSKLLIFSNRTTKADSAVLCSSAGPASSKYPFLIGGHCLDTKPFFVYVVDADLSIIMIISEAKWWLVPFIRLTTQDFLPEGLQVHALLSLHLQCSPSSPQCRSLHFRTCLW